MPKRENIIRHQKNYCKLPANSLAMITKQQIRIIDIEEISLKSDEKNIYHHLSKKLLQALAQFSSHDHKTTC